MRVHLQGAFLLLVMLLAFWVVANWGATVISSAWGSESGVIVARVRDEAAATVAVGDIALDGTEVADLQAALTAAGIDPGPVDGILGDQTRSAIEQAKSALNLIGSSDRELLELLTGASGR